MIIVYEQGDIVFDKINNCYGIVISDSYNESVKILEIDTIAFIETPPREALSYIGHCSNLKKRLLDIVESEVEE